MKGFIVILYCSFLNGIIKSEIGFPVRKNKCLENMLFLDHFDVNTNNLSISINYRLKLIGNAAIGLEELTLPDYVKECIAHLVFRVLHVKSNNVIQEIYELLQETNNNLNDLTRHNKIVQSKVEFNYQFFETYDVEIGYELKDLPKELRKMSTVRRTMCFGSPGPITIFPWNIFELPNDRVLVSWFQPKEINAPAICYYKLTVGSPNENNYKSFQVNEEKFYLKKTEYQLPIKLKIVPVNDFNCYSLIYAQLKECTNLVLNGPEYVFYYGKEDEANSSEILSKHETVLKTGGLTNDANIQFSFILIIIQPFIFMYYLLI